MNGTRDGRRRTRAVLATAAMMIPLVLAGNAEASPSTVADTSGLSASGSTTDHAQDVDPFIGTANARPAFPGGVNPNGIRGDVFPGAAAPHGMLAWSPDTPTNVPGGYWYPDTSITGFSLTHFSGRGCAYKDDFPFMPFSGAVTQSPVAAPSAFRSSFSHANEHASPGYYDVTLDSGTTVKLAAATRSGVGTFDYPTSPMSSLLINAGGSAGGDTAASVQIDPANQQVTGSATASVGCASDTYTVYFVAEFDRAFSTYGTWNGTTLQPDTSASQAPQSGAYLTFDTSSDQTVAVRTAVSYVSVADAEANLHAEVSGWNQQAVRDATTAAWNRGLSSIEVSGGSDAARRVFYTALYHFYLEPAVFNDVNGEYLGFDDKVHTVAPGHVQYSDITTWDGYRSFIPLLALLSPHEASDTIQSLINDAQQNGPGLPRWVQANRNSAGNVADDPDPYIASAYAFGARDFDQSAALRAMDLGATDPDTLSGGHPVRENGADWLLHGYVPQKPGISLEYATDDFSIAQFARDLGQKHLYEKYMATAQNWENVFNPATGYVQQKDASGQWAAGFTPQKRTGFTEGNSAQYTSMIPFNVGGLVNAMGGDTKLVKYLDNLFTNLNVGPTDPYYWHGNEPDEQTPWEYDFAHAPWKTQQVIRQIQTSLYSDTPGGLPGNDDGGALSSWYIWAAVGMYPMTPGSPEMALGSPLFDQAVIHNGNGSIITVNGHNAAPDAPYVQELKFQGRAWPKAYSPADLVEHGGTLDYTLGMNANTAWASGANAVPSSYPDGERPALGYTYPTGSVVVATGGQVQLALGAQNVTTSPEQVDWTSQVPAGLGLSASSGTLQVAPVGNATDTLTLTASATAGTYSITFQPSTPDGIKLGDVVLQVVVN